MSQTTDEPDDAADEGNGGGDVGSLRPTISDYESIPFSNDDRGLDFSAIPTGRDND